MLWIGLIALNVIREERIVGLEAKVRIRLGIAIVVLTVAANTVVLIGYFPSSTLVHVIAGCLACARSSPLPMRICLSLQNLIQKSLVFGILSTAADAWKAIGAWATCCRGTKVLGSRA